MFFPDWFLRSVYGTPPFIEYCRGRRLDFPQRGSTPRREDRQRWVAALARLPRDQYAQVEMELAMVNEMAAPQAVAQLTEVAGGQNLPPEDIPTGAPLALWYFLNRPDLFRAVFLHLEAEESAPWRIGRAPKDLYLSYLLIREKRLATALRKSFRDHEGTGRFCTVSSYWLRESCCFVAHVSDRPRLLEAFTNNGRLATRPLHLALPVVFVYFPADGMVLLRSHLRAHDRVAELFRLFGTAALGATATADTSAFDLEVLKRRFEPLPDGADVEGMRVRSLHLRYPAQDGRRQVCLATRASDHPDAVQRLLETHVGTAGMLDRLRVTYAELQVRLCISGTSKNYLVRLWPNGSNLDASALGQRLRGCLKRWGLMHVCRS